ncbi:MAG TPA: lycopene cyclase domain-containing protein [Micromonosporaceae bacterium]|nr:lycopene cyclase domain-containing protein [Micromonosporaceae bacterium]
MRHLTYLLVLCGSLVSALLLEPLLRVGVLRRWRRVGLTLLPVVAAFALWDIAAFGAGHWSLDPAQTTGVVLPGGLPLEELLFFMVVPLCAVLTFEAARKVLGWPGGDER